MTEPFLTPSQIIPDTPVYDYKAHYASVKSLWEKYPLRTEEATDKHLVLFMRSIRGRLRRPINDDALLALAMDISAYFYADRVYFEAFPSWLAPDELRQLQSDLCSERIDAATAAIADLCVGLLNNFAPESAFDDFDSSTGASRVAMIELARNPNELIGAIIALFAQKTMSGTDRRLFPNSWTALFRNLCLASGHSPDELPPKAKLILPVDSDLSPTELVRTYLRDTGLEEYLLRPVPFIIPEETRFSGHWIVAPQGTGKTTLLHSMVMEDLSKDASIILMDSKGELLEPFRTMKSLQDRLIIIDPNLEAPIGFNPLDVPRTEVNQSIELLEYLFSSLLEFKLTPAQMSLFRNVLRAMVTSFPNPTLETFRDLLANGYKKYEEHIKVLPPDLQDFFQHDFNEDTTRARRREVVQRLSLLLGNDIMRAMFTATSTRFRIADAMDTGKVVIINNSIDILGDQGAEFFGRFFVTQVRAAGLARARRKHGEKKPVYFYIDEAHDVIKRDEFIPKIIDQLRSQKVALIMAHQRVEQIKSPDVLSALANCAIKYANSDEEAGFLAPKLRTTKDFLQSLPRGRFAAFVRGMTSHAIAFTVLKVDFAALPTLTPDEQASLRRRMSHEYGVLPPTATAPPAIEPIAVPETPKAQGPAKAAPPPPPPPRKKKADPDMGSSSDGSPSW